MKAGSDPLGCSMEETKLPELKKYVFICSCIQGNRTEDYNIDLFLTDEQFTYTAGLLELAMGEIVKNGDTSIWFDYYTENRKLVSISLANVVYINTTIASEYSMADHAKKSKFNQIQRYEP